MTTMMLPEVLWWVALHLKFTAAPRVVLCVPRIVEPPHPLDFPRSRVGSEKIRLAQKQNARTAVISRTKNIAGESSG
ncbi:hypothetical protein SNOG_05469 [Parastagonospora nodorum SN15]|uniref:Secreted protein n=1 Tax=Phaeosphaeria nodorum (strain SN15 / ATCC MYA-4574 / FGSC 10173) TaxID=321614 RepID=Q0URZ5_PHANO|nr:hypothetical protein SNOG_05469 [Parastagonospora nodorum SN15]EAT86533.1 hypothetical protein SNOG_05469 [Parastagonospora nodorum SN15]